MANNAVPMAAPSGRHAARRRAPDSGPEQAWSARRSLVFVVGASGLLWIGLIAAILNLAAHFG